MSNQSDARSRTDSSPYLVVPISLALSYCCCDFKLYSSSFDVDVDDDVVSFDGRFGVHDSLPRHDWAKLTVAFSKLRQVVNRCCGGFGNAVRAFTKPRPRPRLQPVIKIDFILPLSERSSQQLTSFPNWCVLLCLLVSRLMPAADT